MKKAEEQSIRKLQIRGFSLRFTHVRMENMFIVELRVYIIHSVYKQ